MINILATSSSVPTWWAGEAYQEPALIPARASARAYALAMTALGVVGVVGLVAAVLLPSELRTATAQDVPQQDGPVDREGVIDNAS
jgi:hypothetical protein